MNIVGVMNIVGGIYRVRTILVRPPKVKIVLYVGDGFFLWFNTIARNRPGQFEVQAAECPEITRECFLDYGVRATRLASSTGLGSKPAAEPPFAGVQFPNKPPPERGQSPPKAMGTGSERSPVCASCCRARAAAVRLALYCA